MPKKITSVEMLKEKCQVERQEFFTLSDYGLGRSWGVQWYPDTKRFGITNDLIDDYQLLSEEELFTESNIGNAIEKGAFYMLQS